MAGRDGGEGAKAAEDDEDGTEGSENTVSVTTGVISSLVSFIVTGNKVITEPINGSITVSDDMEHDAGKENDDAILCSIVRYTTIYYYNILHNICSSIILSYSINLSYNLVYRASFS